MKIKKTKYGFSLKAESKVDSENLRELLATLSSSRREEQKKKELKKDHE
jgi:hypothetical protein